MEGSEESTPPPATADPLSGALRSVGRGASVMVAATLGLLVFQFGTRVLIVHALTTDQWGEFSLALALTSLLALLASFGVPTAVARSLAFEATVADRWRVIRSASTVTFLAAGVSGALVFAFAAQIAGGFRQPALTPILQLFSVTVACSMVSNVLAGFFQGLERVEPNALFNQVLNPGLFLLFTSAFLFFHLGFTGALYGYVLSWVASLGALALYTYLRLPPLVASASSREFEGDRSGRIPLIELSLTLFGVAALGYVTAFGDTLVLGYFRPPGLAPDVAQYSTAMTLARLFLVGAGTITYIYLPVTSRLRRGSDFSTVRRSYVTSSRWLMVITLPLFYLFFFDPGASLAFAFGRTYIPAGPALQILAASSLAAVLLGPAPSALGGLGESRPMVVFTLSSAAANLALSFTLIPLYGLIGAAVAWAVARVVYPALCLGRLWRGYRVTPFAVHSLKPLLLSSAILVPIFLFAVPDPRPILLPFLFLLVLGVFLASIVATRSVDPGDFVIVSAVEKRVGRSMPRLRRFLESHSVGRVPAPGAKPG